MFLIVKTDIDKRHHDITTQNVGQQSQERPEAAHKRTIHIIIIRMSKYWCTWAVSKITNRPKKPRIIPPPSSLVPISTLARILILRQNPLRNQLLRLRPILNLLLQSIRQHMALKLTGMSLQGRRGRGSGEDISYRLCNHSVLCRQQ